MSVAYTPLISSIIYRYYDGIYFVAAGDELKVNDKQQ